MKFVLVGACIHLSRLRILVYAFSKNIKIVHFFLKSNNLQLSQIKRYNQSVVRYIFLIFILFFTLPCYGQPIDETFNNYLPVSYGRGYSGTQPQSESLNKKTKLSPFHISSYEDLLLPPNLPDYWDSYANQPRITYSYKYEGLRGVIFKQINRGLQRLYSQALRNYWDQSYYTDLDRIRILQRHNLSEADAGNRYWEQRRFFFDYLPVEKGGHATQEVTVGSEFRVIELGPLGVSNAGKVSWSGWNFSISSERDLPGRRLRDPDYERPQRNTRDYSLGISPPSGNLYSGNNIAVSGKVRVSVKINDFTRNRSIITGQLNFIGYQGMRKKPWIDINITGRAVPFNNEYAIEAAVVLLVF